MLETKAKIIPVFYGVEPWELRHIEKGGYANAFMKYEEKSRYTSERLTEWKEALQTISFMTDLEFNAADSKQIVSTVQKEMQRIYAVELSNPMASSSSSHRRILEHTVVSGLAPEPSRLFDMFDVFINYRGPDVKEAMALQLYKSLEKLGLRVFLDSQERELGDFFPSTIETAIRSARVHIVIFSKRFAEAPWCLEELVFMLSTEAIIIPLYYDVKPWELRYIEKGGYYEAFEKYQKNARYTSDRLKEWKETLHSASLISGWRFTSDFNLERVVSAVQKQLRRTQFLYVAKYPVGLSELVEELESGCLRELVQDFESQHGMNEEGKGKARVVGIYGMGGAGKTTLSKELFNRYRSKYSRASFLVDVREASARGELRLLQLRLLKDLFDEDHPSFTSTDEGISYLRYAFGRSRRDWRFLIILDDIECVEQIDALLDLDSMNYGCLVIVTTRDVQVLKDANIADGYEMKEMGVGHSRELFCWQAFRQAHPPIGYEDLVDSFVEESGFLPLSLQLFGGLVRDEADRGKWHFYLDTIRKQLSPGIKERLQISVDTLDEEERQMFMDIACFFIDKPKSMAIRIWEACGWKAQQALQKLERKCLLHIADNYLAGYEFDDKLVLTMHDLIRDLGREMADGQSFPRRNWRPQSLESNGLQNILSETSGPSSRCLNSFFDSSMTSQVTYFLGNLDQKRISLLWLELDGCEQPSLPSWIPLQHLRGLRIFSARLKELWQNNSQAPVNLKELVLHECSLAECTNSVGMLNDLEKLVLTGRNEEMLVDGRALSESLRGLSKLRSLVLRYFTLTGELTLNGESTTFSALRFFAWICAPLGNSFRAYFASSEEAELINNREPTTSDSAADRCMCDLQTMEMRGIKRVSKVSISGECCRNLESLHLASMPNLIQVDLTFMRTLNCLELRLCEQLKRVSGNFDLPNLETLNIVKCGKLEELPSLELLKCSKTITIDGCEKLPKITGVEKLMGLRCLHLSGGHIWRCIYSLKQLPSVVTSVIGKANSQAKTILDANQFRRVMGADTNRAIHINETGIMLEESLSMLNSLSAIIICAVVRGSYASGTNPVHICLPSGLIQSNIGGGIWIVTIVITGQKDIRDYKELPTVGDDAQIKNRWIVTIQKGQEGNPLHVLRKIIEELYQ